MQLQLTPTTGQTDFTLPFKVTEVSRLFVVISSQIQYSGISFDLITPTLVRTRQRMRGTEAVEIFTASGDGTDITAFLTRPAFLKMAAPLPKPDGPTLL